MVNILSALVFVKLLFVIFCRVHDAQHPLVIDPIMYWEHSFKIQAEHTRSALDIALELCRFHVTNVTEQGQLGNCVAEIGIQVLYARNIHIFENAFYLDPLRIRIRNPELIPTDGAYDFNASTRSPCIGMEHSPLCVYVDGKLVLTSKVESITNNHFHRAKSRGIAGANVSDVVCSWRHAHVEEEYLATDSSLGMDSTFLKPTYRGAIVILAQAGEHSSYRNRQSLPQLMMTLDLLYQNYNVKHHDDIWIFHEGDFTVELQNDVRRDRNEIRFFKLENENWEVFPSFTKNQSDTAWSVGYRKMIRWFAIRIWRVMANMGYTWVWRMDDDSHLLSPIEYNMFAFMEHYQYQYAYRNIQVESPGPLFWDFIQSYVKKHKISSIDHIMDSCQVKSGIENFTFNNCGNMPGYYNNFFLTNVSRWLESDVQDLLQAFDDSGMIFLERWGDLTIHAAVVRLLFNEQRIHKFTGWGYAHVSKMGIIQGGLFDSDQSLVLKRYCDTIRYQAELYGAFPYMAYDRLETLSVGGKCERKYYSYAFCIC